MDAEALVARSVFVLGPARGGTTLLARLLDRDPSLYGVFTNPLREHRALYDYATESGLCRRLHDGAPLPGPELKAALADALSADGQLLHVDRGTRGARPLDAREALRRLLGRPVRGGPERIDLARLSDRARPLLKSPELCFVAGALAERLPDARFVATWRSLPAVTVSMWRKGQEGEYWSRWRRARDADGSDRLPATLDRRWFASWQRASDLQRCALRALSYCEALERALEQLGPRVLVCSHADLCADFDAAAARLAEFLEIDASALAGGRADLRPPAAAAPLTPAQESEILALPDLAVAWEQVAPRFPESARRPAA